jgi:hemerythrin
LSNNEIVTWHNSYSVGIPLIDDQHKELIRLTNTLYEGVMQGQAFSQAAFLKSIRGTVDYIGYHFSTEERVMKRVDYPGYQSHKKQHSDFVREVLKHVDDFTNGKPFSPNNFVYYLKDWILTHIAVTDKKLGAYLIELKKEGSLSLITLKVKQDEATKSFAVQ